MLASVRLLPAHHPGWRSDAQAHHGGLPGGDRDRHRGPAVHGVLLPLAGERDRGPGLDARADLLAMTSTAPGPVPRQELPGPCRGQSARLGSCGFGVSLRPGIHRIFHTVGVIWLARVVMSGLVFLVQIAVPAHLLIRFGDQAEAGNGAGLKLDVMGLLQVLPGRPCLAQAFRGAWHSGSGLVGEVSIHQFLIAERPGAARARA